MGPRKNEQDVESVLRNAENIFQYRSGTPAKKECYNRQIYLSDIESANPGNMTHDFVIIKKSCCNKKLVYFRIYT